MHDPAVHLPAHDALALFVGWVGGILDRNGGVGRGLVISVFRLRVALAGGGEAEGRDGDE